MKENPDEYVDRMKDCEHEYVEVVLKKVSWKLLIGNICTKCRYVVKETIEEYKLVE